MKIHDLLAQNIFPSKRCTTYECIPELAVTVPSAHSTIVKKIKRFIIWLYKWSRVTFTELLSAVVKNSMTLSSFSMTFHDLCYFHDFPGLENGFPKFHDFPWPGCTLLLVSSSRLHSQPILTWIVDLSAVEPLWVSASSGGHLAAARVNAPALADRRVALLRAELAVVRTLRHVSCRLVLLAGLDLLTMTLGQDSNSI